VQYYDLTAIEGRRPFYACSGTAPIVNRTIGCAFGNSVAGTNTADAVLAHDFTIVGAMAEFTFPFAGRPLQLWGDYARNLTSANLNVAYALGTTWGKATLAQPWDVGLAWQSFGKDALFGQFIDGEFGDGRTDSSGWVLRANYAVSQNAVLGTTWFRNELNMDVGTTENYERLFLDLTVKF
jgi:hypothetical protein